MMNDLICSVSSTLDSEICLRYWALDSAGQWLESLEHIRGAFDLTLEEAVKRVMAGSIARLCHVRCKTCGTPISIRTRAQYEESENLIDAGLLRCDQTLCQPRSRTLNMQLTAARISKRTTHIFDTLSEIKRELKPLDYSRLTSLDAFYLYCVLIASESKWEGAKLFPFAGPKVELAATSLLAKAIYTRLHARKILVPSLHSPTSAFNTASKLETPITFDVFRVVWIIAVDLDLSSKEGALMRLWNSVASSKHELIKELGPMLSEHECLNMLLRRITQLRYVYCGSISSDLLLIIQHYQLDYSLSFIIDSIKLLFNDRETKKRVQAASEDRLAAVISDELKTRLCGETFASVKSNIWKYPPSLRFKKSKFIVSREFARLIAIEHDG